MRKYRWGLAAIVAMSMAPACGGSEFESATGDDGGVGSDGGNGVDGGSSIDGSNGDGGSDGGGPGEASTDGPVLPAVSGRVVDPHLVPIGGVTVRINSHSTTTASDGTFSISGVTTPYSARVASSITGKLHAYDFRKLTRSDPTLQLFADPIPAQRSATLTGAATFPGATSSGHGVAFVDFANAIIAGDDQAAFSQTSLAINLKPAWQGSSSAPATAYELEWTQDSSGLPTGYVAFGQSPVTLVSGSVATWGEPPKGSVNSGQLKAGITFQGGYIGVGAYLFLRPPSSHMAPLVAIDRSMSNSPQYVTPRITGATMVLCSAAVQAANSANTVEVCQAGLDPDAQNVAIAVPGASIELAPSDAAQSVTTSTVFSWSPFASGVHAVAISNDTNAALFIVTSDASTPAPSMPELGAPLVSGATYKWQVFGFAPFANVDAAAGPTGFELIAVPLGAGRGPEVNGALSSSEARSFTVQ